jgi:superoxide reductase
MEAYFFKDEKTGEVRLSERDEKKEGEILLTANTTDAAKEKHVPVVTVDGNKVHVQVGSVLHPMTEAHHIAFIALVTDQKVVRKNLLPTGTPEADFPLADGEKVDRVYEYCNLHGLWSNK